MMMTDGWKEGTEGTRWDPFGRTYPRLVYIAQSRKTFDFCSFLLDSVRHEPAYNTVSISRWRTHSLPSCPRHLNELIYDQIFVRLLGMFVIVFLGLDLNNSRVCTLLKSDWYRTNLSGPEMLESLSEATPDGSHHFYFMW